MTIFTLAANDRNAFEYLYNIRYKTKDLVKSSTFKTIILPVLLDDIYEYYAAINTLFL